MTADQSQPFDLDDFPPRGGHDPLCAYASGISRRCTCEPDTSNWVACSPAWLTSGGDCLTAPRRESADQRYSHEHPSVAAAQPQPVDPRYGRLADAARRVAASHANFIDEHHDPGTEALSAQYVLRQELLWHDMADEPDPAIRLAEADQRTKAIADAIDREDLKWGVLESPEEAEAFAAAVLAVVQPEINQRDAELRRLRAALATMTAAALAIGIEHAARAAQVENVAAHCDACDHAICTHCNGCACASNWCNSADMNRPAARPAHTNT